MQNILVVMEQNSFLVRNVTEQLKELNYNTVSVDLDIQQISKEKASFEAVLLYMESEASGMTQQLVYLRDKAVEEDIPIFYMGEDVSALHDIIPEHILQDIFQRPIDVKVSAKVMDEFIKKHGKQVKKKILVVDDSGAMLRNVKGWLEDKYQVILANSGAMAIKYLATNRPDLVLLDYEMPVVDGRQVLEMIRTETEFCDVPVIFLTSKNDRESIMKVMELKPEGYLLKTMEPKQIVQEVDSFFEKQRIHRATM
ncbi:MAG: response regulator [Lachnospiraceae bacterium]|nr:response regulator [Lachnospiraceae bacterium]